MDNGGKIIEMHRENENSWLSRITTKNNAEKIEQRGLPFFTSQYTSANDITVSKSAYTLRLINVDVSSGGKPRKNSSGI